MAPARASSAYALCCTMGSQAHLNSSVALAELRQKFISDRIGVSSPFDPPGQKPPAHVSDTQQHEGMHRIIMCQSCILPSSQSPRSAMLHSFRQSMHVL